MSLNQKFSFRLSQIEKDILLQLARDDERDPSDWLRFMIRRMARQSSLALDSDARLGAATAHVESEKGPVA